MCLSNTIQLFKETSNAIASTYRTILMLVIRFACSFHQRFLSVSTLLLSPNAAKALLQRITKARIAAPDTRRRGFWLEGVLRRHAAGPVIMPHTLAVTTRRHLCAAIAKPLVVFQLLLDSVGWLALALEVIWVVFLGGVSKRKQYWA